MFFVEVFTTTRVSNAACSPPERILATRWLQQVRMGPVPLLILSNPVATFYHTFDQKRSAARRKLQVNATSS